jgi:hypothetical protein
LALHAAPVDPHKMVARAARTHWRAAAWLLERTHPDRLAKRPPNSCSPETPMDVTAWLIETALEATPPEHREAVYRRRRAARRPSSAMGAAGGFPGPASSFRRRRPGPRAQWFFENLILAGSRSGQRRGASRRGCPGRDASLQQTPPWSPRHRRIGRAEPRLAESNERRRRSGGPAGLARRRAPGGAFRLRSRSELGCREGSTFRRAFVALAPNPLRRAGCGTAAPASAALDQRRRQCGTRPSPHAASSRASLDSPKRGISVAKKEGDDKMRRQKLGGAPIRAISAGSRKPSIRLPAI